jgi:two-component system sensor histidine kinase KdpD
VNVPLVSDEPDVTFVRAEDLLAESMPTEVSRTQWEISRPRRFLTAIAAVFAVAVLTWLLKGPTSGLSNEGKVVLYLPIVATAAAFGGMFVGGFVGVVSAVTINWFFFEPVHSLSVSRTDQAISLFVFVGIAVLVSGAIEVAVSRAALARETIRQAETLSALAHADLGGAESVHEVLERARSTFRMESVILKERNVDSGEWTDVEAVGWTLPGESAALRFDLPVGTSFRLQGRGPELFATDRRALQAFADATATAIAGLTLSERARKADEMAVVDRQRTALLSAVGHDLRTPIAGIRAAAETLCEPGAGLSKEQGDKLLSAIVDSASLLDRLVANLLDASRLQAGSVVAAREPVALDGLIASAVLAIPAAEGRVAIEVADDFPMLSADPGLLERVFSNLIDNAITHGGEDPQVRITALATSEDAKIEILDSGPGVPEGREEAIFAPFDGGGDRSVGGTGLGLGLSIARGFLEAMDGAISAESPARGGLLIRIRIPLAQRRSGVT